MLVVGDTIRGRRWMRDDDEARAWARAEAGTETGWDLMRVALTHLVPVADERSAIDNAN